MARSRQGGIPEELNVGGENGGGEMFGVDPDIPFKRTAFNHQKGSTSDWKTLGVANHKNRWTDEAYGRHIN